MRTEDGEIIRQCLDGKSTAFGFLVDKYKKSVYALAYSEIRNFHDAQDVTQEVFLKAYRNLHTLRRWDNFMGWLYRITVNICRDWVRSESKRPDSEYLEDQEPAVLENPSMESYREDIISEAIHDALESLPEIYRQVMTLRYFGGMTIREMSSFLGVSTTTIERRVSEGQSRLKEEILTMMTISKQHHDLPTSFTFQIIEAVKNIRIQSIPPSSLPWGLSLALGLVFVLLSIGSHINISGSLPEMVESLLSGKEYAITIGDFMPFKSFSHQASFGSGANGNGNGVVPALSQDQMLAMVPAEGGKIPDKPSAQLGKGRNIAIGYSLDGKLFIVGESRAIKLYNADNLNEIGSLQSIGGVCCLAISPDSKILASGEYDQLIHLWDIQERREIGILGGHTGYISGIVFSPDGTMLASCAYDKSIRVWDVKEQKQLSISSIDINYPHTIAFNHDGRLLASKGYGDKNMIFQLWNVKGQGKLELAQNIDNIYSFAFNTDGKTMVLGTINDNEPLLIWDINTKKQIGELKAGAKSSYCMAFSSDGKWLASGDLGGSIYLWDMQNQKQAGILSGHIHWINSLNFSPDSKTLASNSPGDKNIIIWDIEGQKQIGVLNGYSAAAGCIAFSPNGKMLASSEASESVGLWDMKEQKQIGELYIADSYPAIVTFNPEGKLLAVGYSSGGDSFMGR